MAKPSKKVPAVTGKIFQRFEAKYILNDVQAEMVRSLIVPYVISDPYVKWGEDYQINSVYLDNDQLSLYWSSMLGEKNRFKLRIRTYNDKPEDPCFFEIKRRVNQIIVKQRAIVKREYIVPILEGRIVGYEALFKPTYEEMQNLCQFRDYVELQSMRPRVMVRYLREAYMGAMGEPVRITFDRHLCALHAPRYDPAIWTYDARWSRLYEFPVVLEIKFTDQYPSYVQDIVNRLGLVRDSCAKYCHCLDALEREGRQVAGTPKEQLAWTF